jgi:hypothetical protein
MTLSKKFDAARERWLATRKQVGLQIDPETAEVTWIYTQTLDPYGVYPELPEEYQQVGREYFARNPGSEVWVLFGDLPDATREALWQRHRANLAFPAGLPGFDLHHAGQQRRECQFEPTSVNEEPGR